MLTLKSIKRIFNRNNDKTMTIFSFPHATKEQLDELLKGVGQFGKTCDDVIFSNTDLRDGSTVNLKIKGKRK